MDKTNDYWTRFWADKTDPLHSASDDAYYDRLASELRLVLPENFSSVLEVGCGNGCLYQRLGFDRVSYRGIDYSPSMIRSFIHAYPGACVEVGDFRNFAADDGFDLIFSNGVMQYVTLAEFDRQLAFARRLLAPGGHVVHAGVLRASCRNALMSGELGRNQGSWLKRSLLFASEWMGVHRSMGYWYPIPEVRRLAEKNGFSASFLGSMLTPYRFHVVMQKLL
jgi:cyclopropane fatty-acyl-phospholipid synthase-like methyltransferase